MPLTDLIQPGGDPSSGPGGTNPAPPVRSTGSVLGFPLGQGPGIPINAPLPPGTTVTISSGSPPPFDPICYDCMGGQLPDFPSGMPMFAAPTPPAPNTPSPPMTQPDTPPIGGGNPPYDPNAPVTLPTPVVPTSTPGMDTTTATALNMLLSLFGSSFANQGSGAASGGGGGLVASDVPTSGAVDTTAAPATTSTSGTTIFILVGLAALGFVGYKYYKAHAGKKAEAKGAA